MGQPNRKVNDRKGAVVVLVLLLLVPLIAMAAFSIDLGNLAMARSELQAAADASALAGAAWVETNGNSVSVAISKDAIETVAAANVVAGKHVIVEKEADIEFGYWDSATRSFGPPRNSDTSVNAVRVVLRRNDGGTGGAVQHAFAPVFGVKSHDLRAESIAFFPRPVPTRREAGTGTRFLIDDEMFQTDAPAIEALARQMRKSEEWLLSAKNEKSSNPHDWFLNLPAGVILELPTGQVGDEGLMDIAINDGYPNLPQYPYRNDPERHLEFLYYNETSENDSVSKMRSRLFTDKQLDPLKGVGRFNQPGLYPELVNPDFVHVSPVYKSDISALDGVKDKNEKAGPDLNEDGKADGYTTNEKVKKGVSAKGYRRGLVAFRILDYRIDKDYKFPYLPNLIIQIVDPKTINMSEVEPVDSTFSKTVFTSGGVHNVRLAR